MRGEKKDWAIKKVKRGGEKTGTWAGVSNKVATGLLKEVGVAGEDRVGHTEKTREKRRKIKS